MDRTNKRSTIKNPVIEKKNEKRIDQIDRKIEKIKDPSKTPGKRQTTNRMSKKPGKRKNRIDKIDRIE